MLEQHLFSRVRICSPFVQLLHCILGCTDFDDFFSNLDNYDALDISQRIVICNSENDYRLIVGR